MTVELILAIAALCSDSPSCKLFVVDCVQQSEMKDADAVVKCYLEQPGPWCVPGKQLTPEELGKMPKKMGGD